MRDVRRGGVIELWCRFHKHNADGSVTLIDPSSITVVVSDPDSNPVSSYTYGTQPNLIRASKGIYRLDYPVSLTASTGTWSDEWTAVIEGNTIVTSNAFLVFTEYAYTGDGGPMLSDNTLYSVVFDSRIKDADGVEIGTDLYYIFVTELSPMYATVSAVRTNYATYVSDVNDMTIALLIHDFSVEVDAIMPTLTMPTDPEALSRLNVAMYRYVLCGTGHKLLGDLMGRYGGSKRARLGDLDISYGPGVASIRDDWLDAEKCMEKWRLALESMGQYLDVIPAASVGRGKYSADRMDIGRTIDPSLATDFGVNGSAYRRSRVTGQYGLRPVRTWFSNPGTARRSY